MDRYSGSRIDTPRAGTLRAALRRRSILIASCAAVAVMAAGCSSGASSPTSTPTTSASRTTPSPTTTSGGSALAAATAAVVAYETANGPATSTWQITSTQVSSVDPSYVLFRIGPAPGHENDVQGGYGFVHNEAGAWTVIGFGSSEVGCPPGTAQTPVVPTPVLTGFGLTCPTTG